MAQRFNRFTATSASSGLTGTLERPSWPGSTASCDHFLHDHAASLLQWAHPSPGEKPHPFVFVSAVNNIDPVASDSVMERGSRILGKKFEKCLAPRVVSVMKDFFAKLFKFRNLDGPNRFGDGFAALFIQVLEIKFFKWHKRLLIRFAEVDCF